MNYLSQARKKQFEIPKYLELLVDKAIDLFNLSGISCVDMLQYMLEHDINNWVHYYAYTFIMITNSSEIIGKGFRGLN